MVVLMFMFILPTHLTVFGKIPLIFQFETSPRGIWADFITSALLTCMPLQWITEYDKIMKKPLKHN